MAKGEIIPTGSAASLIKQAGERHRITSAGRVINSSFYADTDLIETLLPEVGDNHPVFTGLFVTDIVVTKEGQLSRAEIVYDQPNRARATEINPPFSTGTGGGTDTELLAATSNAQEIPIEQHPDYGTWTAAQKASLAGVTSYLLPNPTFTRTTFVTTWSWTESAVVENVGKLEDPTGMTSPTASKWLKVAYDVREVGGGWEITEVWQYASKGWSTLVYESA